MEKVKIDEEKGEIEIKLDPKLYSLDVIYSTAYVFLDKAYIKLDGNPEQEVIVQLKTKNKDNTEKLKNDFYNELLNYAFYKRQTEKTGDIRKIILQKVLFTNDNNICEECDEEFEFDDPEGIATPWEEKYGKDTDKNKS
jgi:His-Xaa-Ser system protein HxsD